MTGAADRGNPPGAAGTEEPLPALPGPFIGFQLKHIGDFLLTLPALGLIKRAWPTEKVTLALPPGLAELAALHPWVDEVIELDRAAGLRNSCKAIKRIRQKRFGAAFIFDGQTRSIVAARLAGIKNRVGASRLYPLACRSLYTLDVDIAGENSYFDSQALRGQKMVAKALGLAPGPGLRPPMLRVDEAAIQAITPLLGELEGQGPRVGLTLQGMQPEKTWPLANFVELCQRLWGAYRARLFVTGGPAEKPLAEALTRAAKVPVANFCGRTTLPQVVGLAAASDLFITVDTGTSHLVALTETPLISIFIWTNPVLWPPQSPRAYLLCYEWALARFGLKAGDGPWQVAPVITPEMVWGKAREVLEEGKRPKAAAAI